MVCMHKKKFNREFTTVAYSRTVVAVQKMYTLYTSFIDCGGHVISSGILMPVLCWSCTKQHMTHIQAENFCTGSAVFFKFFFHGAEKKRRAPGGGGYVSLD